VITEAEGQASGIAVIRQLDRNLTFSPEVDFLMIVQMPAFLELERTRKIRDLTRQIATSYPLTAPIGYPSRKRLQHALRQSWKCFRRNSIIVWLFPN
jgi:hypothetical protein